MSEYERSLYTTSFITQPFANPPYYEKIKYFPFSKIWDILENEERKCIINKTDASITKAKDRNACNWHRCDRGSLDERIWFKIPEELRNHNAY
jgi:hypothetical protein